MHVGLKTAGLLGPVGQSGRHPPPDTLPAGNARRGERPPPGNARRAIYRRPARTAGAARGSSSTSRAPCWAGAAARRPPWAAAMALAMASPRPRRPRPARAPARELGHGRGQARPLSLTSKRTARRLGPAAHRHRPAPMLDGVGDQVAQRLGESDALAVDHGQPALPLHGHRHARGPTERPRRLHGIGDQRFRVERRGAPTEPGRAPPARPVARDPPGRAGRARPRARALASAARRPRRAWTPARAPARWRSAARAARGWRGSPPRAGRAGAAHANAAAPAARMASIQPAARKVVPPARALIPLPHRSAGSRPPRR